MDFFKSVSPLIDGGTSGTLAVSFFFWFFFFIFLCYAGTVMGSTKLIPISDLRLMVN